MSDRFITRHNGPSKEDVAAMLKTVRVDSIEALIDQTIPSNIRLKNDLDIGEPMSEFEYAAHISDLGAKNKVFKSYIGLGYYNTIIPPVVQRIYWKILAGILHILPTKPKFHKGD